MKKLITLAVAILFAISAESQTIRYVKPTGIQGAGYQGPYSWQNQQAYRDLQDAINDSQAGDEVWVAQGTYRPRYDSAFVFTNYSRWSTYVLKEGVKVRGSFMGMPGQEGNLAFQSVFGYPSVITGDMMLNDSMAFPWPGAIQMYPPYIEDNAYSLVRNITPLSPATVFEHFVVRHAFYLDTTLQNWGNEKVIGAIFLKENANPTLSNLILIQNRGAVGYLPNFTHFPGLQSAAGSAITIINSSPLIKSCQFYRNFNGAAIAVNNFTNPDTVVIRECLFLDNYGGDAGAVIFAHGAGNVAMINCLMHKNFSNYGTGLLAQGYWSINPVNVTIQNGTYLENNMISLAYPGRLFYLIATHPSVNVKVSNSVIWNNGPKETTANTPDGIFYFDQGATLQINNSIVEYGWPHYKANVLNVDPLFLPLPNTDLSPLDFDYLSAYNCYSNSPMINPNLPQLYFNVAYDIKGNPRDNNPDLSSFEFVGPITKVNNNYNLVSYHIYPNPAQNSVNVFLQNYKNTTLRIYDLIGHEIMNRKITNYESNIDISSLTNGLYIIKITDENNQVIVTQKLTKL